MDWGWTFSVKYDDLKELAASTDERHMIRLSERLRAFLAEGQSIADLANRRFGLVVRFRVRNAALQHKLVVPAESLELNAQFFPGPAPDNRDHVDVGIEAFRTIQIAAYRDKRFSVLDLVDGAANVAGGVHTGPTPAKQWLVPLCEEIFDRDRQAGLSILKAIAAYVVDAYDRLRESLVKSRAAAQPRQQRQPRLIIGAFPVMEFDGNALLEDAFATHELRGFAMGAIIALGPQSAGRRVLFDVGPRDTFTPRFSLDVEGDKLLFRFTAEDGVSAEVAVSSPPLRRFVIVVASCAPWRSGLVPAQEGLKITLSAAGAQQSQTFPGILLPKRFEGKRTAGADLAGRNGAAFQMESWKVWDGPISAEQAEAKMIPADQKHKIPPGWQFSLAAPATVAKLYNQVVNPPPEG